MAFFEIRQYTILPGKMDEWLSLMHKELIPFQVSKGMVICGSFQGESDDSVYFWIRRFENEQHRETLYQAVYESETWKNDMSPRVRKLMDRGSMVVHRVVPTAMSSMQ